MIRLAAIGGGTGLSALMRGLKRYNGCFDLTGIVTITDNGGSSGAIRREMNIPPPGDVRSNIVALAKDEDLLTQLIGYRFRGEGVFEGHSVGNIILAALTRILGSFPEAVKRLSEVLAIKGKVLPVSDQIIHLVAVDEDGNRYVGEDEIVKARRRIVQLTTDQPMMAMKEVIACVKAADGIVLGPGSLYTSIIPNLLAEGLNKAITQNKHAKKLYIGNIMTQPGETEGFSLSDHYREIRHYLGDECDWIIANSQSIPQPILYRYSLDNAFLVENDMDSTFPDVISYPLVKMMVDPRDQLEKVRHDEDRLSEIVYQLFTRGKMD